MCLSIIYILNVYFSLLRSVNLFEIILCKVIIGVLS